jgi:hypothetical protein
MIELTELERAVLNKLLEGNHPLLMQLRKDLSICRVSRREMTGAGFYTHFDAGVAPTASNSKLRFGDVVAEIDGMTHGAGFVLYVENGRLSMLEGYGYDDPWPSTITGYTLKYTTGNKRDWGDLKRSLGTSGEQSGVLS